MLRLPVGIIASARMSFVFLLLKVRREDSATYAWPPSFTIKS
jgi:hypothetical protein